MGRLALRRWTGTGSDSEQYRAALRRAQWSAYFNRFYGGAWGGAQIPPSFKPLTYDQVTRILENVCKCEAKSEKGRRARRTALGRTVSQLLLAGYEPSGLRDRAFQNVVCHAAGRKLPDDAGEQRAADEAALAVQELRADVESEYPKESVFQRQTFSLEDELERQKRGAKKPVSVPTHITHRGDAFAVEKTVYYLRPTITRRMQRIINPINWIELGDFFVVTDREDAVPERKAKGKTRSIDLDTEPWGGVLHEKFRIDWNGLTTQTYDQYLKIDYTVTPDLTRADYFLMYEVDDQIALNEGYFEVRKVGKYPGWISVTMLKTVKFTSILTNLMAPAILAMFLDSQIGGFNAVVEGKEKRTK